MRNAPNGKNRGSAAAMRQGPNSRRSRGRGNGRHQNVPLRHQTFDSNGPDVRIRGNAFQVYEKYIALARDATTAGDRIAAENYYQHAEHYFRIISLINESNSGNGEAAQHGQGKGRNQPRTAGLADNDSDEADAGPGDDEAAAEGDREYSTATA